MILGDPAQATAAADPGGTATLGDFFRRAAARRPEALALVDPPNRQAFTDGPPQRLTYAQADRAIAAVAARLRRLGLSSDAIVGIQLPNIVENVLTVLGVLRAGMIAAPMPILWRRADLVSALSRLGAKALITCGRVGATDHADLAMQAAADIFTIRYVCAFGDNLPDGVVPLDDPSAAENLEPLPPIERERGGNPAAHLAFITWDVAADSLVPVARNHMEIVAGGLAILLESRFKRDTAFLSVVAPSSFAGMILTLPPWLLTCGTLHLHHPFDPDSLRAQLSSGCDAAILPGPVVPRLAEAGFFRQASGLKTVLGLWRAPERMNTAAGWREAEIAFLDVIAFGETGAIASRRDTNGKPAPIPLGVVAAPRGMPGGVPVLELSRTEAGTIALRGPMVPRHPFPPGAERGTLACFKSANGWVDSGYACRVDRDANTLVVTGPPVGIVAVGGYRFPLQELQSLVAGIENTGGIAVLPDSLSGQRLAGIAANVAAMRAALIQRGANPLVAGAFAAHEPPTFTR